MANPHKTIDDLYTENTPFDDEKLVYNKDFHMYLLNKDAIFNVFQETYDDDTLGLSLSVYNFIYSFKTPERFDKMEFLLSHDKYYREALYYALLWQYYYNKSSQGDIAQWQHAVDLDNKDAIPLDKLRGELMISTAGYLTLQRYGLLNSAFSDGDDFDYDYYRSDY